MITKFGDLMIIATPCPPSYHRDPGVSGQSRQLRAPSTDYAKALPADPVRKPHDNGTRHHGPPTIRLVNLQPQPLMINLS
jgi:hypothetical protein